MPSSFSTLDRRTKLIVAGISAFLVLAIAAIAGFGVAGAWPRSYAQISGEEVLPATNTGLGRAVSAMHDLHYLCTEGKPARAGVRGFACSGPEGWAEIEATTAGKVTYLTLISRGDSMSDERATAVGRALVNGAELSQDAKIAARSVTDGRADMSTGPWGTAMSGEAPYRLVFIGSDRPKLDKPAMLGPAAALRARLAKQSCSAPSTPTPSAVSGAPGAKPSGSIPPASPPASVAASAPPAIVLPTARPTGAVTTCHASNRLVTTAVSYTTVDEQVSRVTVRSSALFAYGWTHTEAINALRAAMTDLGQDATAVGDWVAANADKQGTIALGPLLVEVNSDHERSVTSVTVTRVA